MGEKCFASFANQSYFVRLMSWEIAPNEISYSWRKSAEKERKKVKINDNKQQQQRRRWRRRQQWLLKKKNYDDIVSGGRDEKKMHNGD